MSRPGVSVIGAGISGLIAASLMAKRGHQVDVFEKNSYAGGRIRTLVRDGYRFDMGPSWYWMPGLIDDHFKLFGYSASDFYSLVRLDPSYTVFWKDESPLHVPSDITGIYDWMESRETGSSRQFEKFIRQAEMKYVLGMQLLSENPMQKFSDFLDMRLIMKAGRLELFKTMYQHLHFYFKDPKIIALLSFPVLFLGGTTRNIPALYSLMNFADLKLGTWYPMGGMSRLSEAWHQIALEQGVRFHFNEEVRAIHAGNRKVTALETDSKTWPVKGLIAAGDYHHIEQTLLPEPYRKYNAAYWNKRVLAPSALLIYVGINRRVPGLSHHNLFFDEDADAHARTIYENPSWPEKPLFYLSCPSKTEAEIAPPGYEHFVILVPLAPGLKESPDQHENFFQLIFDRLQYHLDMDLRPHIHFRQFFGITDFSKEYHAYKGNAYGLANTLLQTAGLKPSLSSKYLENMVYCGQMTHPGPGIPPGLISGRLAATLLMNKIS